MLLVIYRQAFIFGASMLTDISTAVVKGLKKENIENITVKIALTNIISLDNYHHFVYKNNKRSFKSMTSIKLGYLSYVVGLFMFLIL